MRLACFALCCCLGFGTVGVASASSYTGIARVFGPGLGVIGTANGSDAVSAEDSFVSDRVGYFAQSVGQASDGFVTGYTSVRIESEESGIGGVLSARAGGNLRLTDLIVTRLPGFADLPDPVEPMVDHKTEREEALRRLKAATGG